MWRRGALALAALLLLVLAVLGARTTSAAPAAVAVPPAPAVVPTAAPPTAGPHLQLQPPHGPDQLQPDRTLQRVVAALALFGLAALVAYALWRFARTLVSDRTGRLAAPAASAGVAVPAPDIDVAAAVVVAEQQLTGHADRLPADAIIAAWLALEDAAAGAGVARQPHQTPTEFTMDVLTIEGVDAAALAELRRCYQLARFGPATTTADDVATAVAALRRIRNALPARTPA